MRLFALRTQKRGPLVKDQSGAVIYFDNKMDAKQHRDSLPSGTVVTFGPDHKLYITTNKGE
jgi:hypothetical protein